MSQKIYKNAPIVEAVCELVFDQASQMNADYEEQIYELLKDQYPQKKLVTNYQPIIETKSLRIEKRIAPQERIQFFNESDTIHIKISQNTLSVSQLAPYPSWNEYLGNIQNITEKYKSVVNPESILRVTLKYTNKIDFSKIIEESEELISIESYFNVYPHISDELPQQVSSFFLNLEFPVAGDNSLNIHITNLGTQILFELKFNNGNDDVNFENFVEWLNTAHDQIESFFEGSITDKTRKLIGEED
ncbi:TIGR04255 family protein [Paenibacillus qinlingensis]|uniref:TIGR04255 family protein n=1 Tax=Paenibacillus qinlingensis TaxID=1837343 RepID=UPI001567475E|nr:TIGR04255 family protein [Paenibacillus qinlingensis]NQX61116.1 TIGR04255 family protein [Paenibacillus qinlingensis]